MWWMDETPYPGPYDDEEPISSLMSYDGKDNVRFWTPDARPPGFWITDGSTTTSSGADYAYVHNIA